MAMEFVIAKKRWQVTVQAELKARCLEKLLGYKHLSTLHS